MAKQSSKSWKIALIALGLAVVLGGLLALWLVISQWKTGGSVARVYQDGKEVYAVDLSQVKEPYLKEITGEGGARNVLRIEPGKISMAEASCPDQVCVHTGAIDSGILPIVCLPNHIVVRIEAAGAEQP